MRTSLTEPGDPAYDLALTRRLLDAAAGLELAAVGVATAEPFDSARAVIERRKAAGLHAGMAFTYRNPARSCDPSRSLPGARSLLVAAREYRRRPPVGPPVPSRARGLVARYAAEDHYGPLRVALASLGRLLEAEGWRSRVLVDDNALVDRAAAHRAGLGWFGKNTNLLLPGRGSWFVLGSLVTDAALRPTPAAGATGTEAGCGSCTRCLPACPTGALVAPGVLDANRCLAWLLEAPGVFPRPHRVALGGRIYGCDDCQEVCPPNRTIERHHVAGPAGSGAASEIDLVDLLDADDDELLVRHGRWYVAGRDPAILRRNALVAIGNVGDAGDPDVVRVVADGCGDPRALVRAHAVWAAARLGLGRLCDELARRERDPLVLAELGERPPPRSP